MVKPDTTSSRRGLKSLPCALHHAQAAGSVSRARSGRSGPGLEKPAEVVPARPDAGAACGPKERRRERRVARHTGSLG